MPDEELTFEEIEARFGGKAAPSAELSFEDIEKQYGGKEMGFEEIEAQFGGQAKAADPFLADVDAMVANRTAEQRPPGSMFVSRPGEGFGLRQVETRTPEQREAEDVGRARSEWADGMRLIREADAGLFQQAVRRFPMSDGLWSVDPEQRQQFREMVRGAQGVLKARAEENPVAMAAGDLLKAPLRGALAGQNEAPSGAMEESRRQAGLPRRLTNTILETGGAGLTMGAVGRVPGLGRLAPAAYGAAANPDDPVGGALTMQALVTVGGAFEQRLAEYLPKLPLGLRKYAAAGGGNVLAGNLLGQTSLEENLSNLVLGAVMRAVDSRPDVTEAELRKVAQDAVAAEAGRVKTEAVEKGLAKPEEAFSEKAAADALDAIEAGKDPVEALEQRTPLPAKEGGTDAGYKPTEQAIADGDVAPAAIPLVRDVEARGASAVASGVTDGEPYVIARAPDGRAIVERGEPVKPAEAATRPQEGRTEADPAEQAASEALDALTGEAVGELTSSKNRIVDYERAALHMAPLEGTPVRGMKAQEAEARRRLAEDSTLPERLTRQVVSGEKVPSAEDTAVLAMHRVKLGKAYEEAVKRLAEAQKSGDPQRVAEAMAETTAARTVLDENGVALNVGGSEQGRGLGSRRWMVDDEFTLRRMEIDALAANEGKPLGKEEAAKDAALQQRVLKADARVSALEERLSAIEAKRALGKVAARARTTKYGETNKVVTRDAYEAAAEAVRAKLGGLRTGIPVDVIPDLVKMGVFHLEAGSRGFARWSAKMVKRLGESVRPHLRAIYAEALKQAPQATDETGLSEAGKIAELVMREGVKGRDAVIDEVHSILKETSPEVTRRQVMDAISGYGKVRPLNPDPVKAELRELKGQMQQLAKLADMAAGKAPLKSGPERQAPGDEQRRLIKEVNEAKRQGGYGVRDPAAQLKSAQDAIKTRLKNDIADLDRQIAAGKRDLPDRTRVALDPEATALKTRRDALKQVLDALDPVVRPERTEAQRIATAEKAIERATREYERRVRENDLEPQRKADEAFDERKRKLLAPAQAERDMARQKWQERLAQKKLQQQSLATKAVRAALLDAPALFRVLKTTGDFSLAFLQGGFRFAAGLTSPKRMAGFGRSLREGFKAFGSERLQAKAEARIKSDPGYDLASRSKTKFGGHGTTKVEEALRSKWADKIPLINNFQRFGQTYMNRLRLEAHKVGEAAMSRTGKLTAEESAVLSNFVNITTGRGHLGAKLEPALDGLNHVFFAPRWTISRFQVLLAPLSGFRYGKGATARTRRYIATEYARSFVGIALVMGLAKAAGADIDLDTDSSTFGTIKVGDTTIDLFSGVLQAATFLKRSGVALFEDDPKERDQSRTFAGDYVRGKLAPLPGAFASRAYGTTLGYDDKGKRKKATYDELGKDVTVPIAYGDFEAAIKEHGPLAGSALGVLSIFGVRLKTYDRDRRKRQR